MSALARLIERSRWRDLPLEERWRRLSWAPPELRPERPVALIYAGSRYELRPDGSLWRGRRMVENASWFWTVMTRGLRRPCDGDVSSVEKV